MGYFNIFYKITRVIDMLTRKRNRRAIMFILIIIAVIFLLHNKGYCAQEDSTYTTDTTYYILEQYQTFVYQFMKVYNDSYNNPPENQTTQMINEIFTKLGQGYFMYIYNHSETNARIYMYKHDFTKTLVDTSLVYNDYTRIPSTCWNITIPSGSKVYVMNNQTGIITWWNSNADINVAVPTILYKRTPVEIVNLMANSGFGYNGTNETLLDIKALLEEQNTNLNSINESLTNTTYNENVVDIDTSTIDNVSDTEIQGLFTSVISSFQNELKYYGGTIIKIIPLPHGGQIEIPSNIVSSHLGNLTALIEAFWYFVFGIYLFRFVSNLIHKIKTGDILNGYTNDNEIITSSML